MSFFGPSRQKIAEKFALFKQTRLNGSTKYVPARRDETAHSWVHYYEGPADSRTLIEFDNRADAERYIRVLFEEELEKIVKKEEMVTWTNQGDLND